MQLRVRTIGRGMYEDEVIVAVSTREGDEEMLLDANQVDRDLVDIGNPVGRMNGHFLVELPRETTRGQWRVWVNESSLAGVAA